MDDVVDFYVAALVQTSGVSWIVCKNVFSHCLAIHDTAAAAIATAIEMAQYQAAYAIAQVHARDENGQWRTVWCAPGVAPRHP